ncbi:MAG: SpoIIE family protein phosphatase [Spirochaetes bacterium]|nr:SpoIIE family protein phosphatase [Spirochaetota bacterium]MBU1079951.1 SpoIIE family protein phosphatase [Spirochaetota bacterium]
MTINSFMQVVASPLLPRLAVLACAGALLFALRRKDAEGRAGSFIVVASFLAARDLALYVIPAQEAFLLTDIAYLCIVLFIVMAPYRAMRPYLAVALALNAVAAGLYSASVFFGLSVAVPAAAFGAVLAADAVAVGLAGALHKRDDGDTASRLLAETWLPVSAALLAYAGLSLALGYEHPVFARLAAPVSYAWLLLVGLAGSRIHDGEMVAAVSYYEESIDSLYNLSFRVGTVLKGSFSTEDVLGSMNDVLISETGADGGSIFLVDEFDDIIVAKAYSGIFPPPFALPESLPRKANRVESYMRHAQFRLGETIFGDVAKTGKNIFAPDVSADGRFVANGDEEFLRISSFMAVPLMVEDKIIGVQAVVKTRPGERFDEADFDRCKLLANFGTLAVSNFFSFLEANERSGIERSAGIAAEIQRTIIPKKLPQFPSLAIGAFTAPARGVSGDYYDVIRTREDRIVGVIGDVAGKGVSAALIMVMIRSILHLITNTNRDIATVLDWVNRGITGKIDMDHYATLGIVAIDIGSGELEYANASHQPLLVYRRATDTIETIDTKSVPIGVEKATEYQRKALRLYDGDIAALYTDGIVEAMNEQGKQFGRKSLGQAIAKHRDLAPKDIAGRIRAEVAAFIGDARQHDDQTVLVFKMKL